MFYPLADSREGESGCPIPQAAEGIVKGRRVPNRSHIILMENEHRKFFVI